MYAVLTVTYEDGKVRVFKTHESYDQKELEKNVEKLAEYIKDHGKPVGCIVLIVNS